MQLPCRGIIPEPGVLSARKALALSVSLVAGPAIASPLHLIGVNRRSRIGGSMSRTGLIVAAAVFVILGAVGYLMIR